MGGQGGAVDVVRRVLNGGELADVVFLGQHDDAAGVLAGGALYAHAARDQAILFGARGVQTAFFEILVDVAVGCFFSQCAYRARAEHVALAEKLLYIGMCARLVHAREVKVYIGHLVAVEAQEGFKGNIVPVFIKLSSALRTNLVRQIHTTPNRSVVNELHMFAVGTNIMGTKGIYLCYFHQKCNKGGTNRSPGSHQISILQ